MRGPLVALTLFVAISGRAQDAAARIDAYVNSQVEQKKFMGSVLAAKDGKIVLARGYGMANLELDVPNKPETRFRIGSIAKQFAAAAILQLEEKGKLSVADPISKYVPDCPPAWSAITFRHLLSHTSGIPNFTNFPDYATTWMLPSRPEQTVKRFRDRPLDFQPGERWSYSNSAYALLAYLLEKISGMKYEDYIRQNVLAPAGMTDSGNDVFEEILKNRATGYSLDRGRWINSHYHDMTIPLGAGDLYSTVLDMWKWDRALTAGKVLSKASLDKMYTPVMYAYGYGTNVDRQYGRLRYGHSGGINGFSSFFARFPEQNAAVVVLANMDFANTGDVYASVVRLLFDEPYTQPEDRKAITLDPAALPQYAGVYEMSPGSRMTVFVEDGKLYAMPQGATRTELVPEAQDRFFYKTIDVQIAFLRPVDGGPVNRLIIRRAGVETEAKRISSAPPARPKEIALDPTALAEFAGFYEFSPQFAITVTVQNGKLFGQATGQPAFELFASAPDKFFLKVVDAQVDFERGPGGQVTGLTLHQAGRDLQFKRK